MTRGARACVLVGVFLVPASPAAAQLWEVHLGPVASYGAAVAFGPGAGALVGLAPGRFAYAGLRYMYYAGSTTPVGTAPSATEVRNRVQLFGVDLSLMIPAGRVDIMPGVGFGAAQFTQDTRAVGAAGSWQSSRTTEFFAAPGAAVEVSLGRIALVPELQYGLSTQPRLAYPVQPQGLLASVRIVMTFEIDRIRQ